MDTGSGHIWNKEEIDMRNVKGELVEWKVGEEVEVKGCLFYVQEIKVFPEDLIVLKGKAKIEDNSPIKKLYEEIHEKEESHHKILDFARNIKRK
jgi:hypothetical protein